MEKGKSSSKVKKPTNGRGKHPLTPACVMWVHPATAGESSLVSEHHLLGRGHRRPAGWFPGLHGEAALVLWSVPSTGQPPSAHPREKDRAG